jgi:hypothetical protein
VWRSPHDPLRAIVVCGPIASVGHLRLPASEATSARDSSAMPLSLQVTHGCVSDALCSVCGKWVITISPIEGRDWSRE